MQRTTFDVPFSQLATADLRVPLSANPRYHYDPEHRVVHVTHDPLPQLAEDAILPVRGARRGARDQMEPDDNGSLWAAIEAFLRERLSPEDYAELCEMCGTEPETFDEDLESERHKVPFGGAEDAARSRERSRFVRNACARLKFAGL